MNVERIALISDKLASQEFFGSRAFSVKKRVDIFMSMTMCSLDGTWIAQLTRIMKYDGTDLVR